MGVLHSEPRRVGVHHVDEVFHRAATEGLRDGIGHVVGRLHQHHAQRHVEADHGARLEAHLARRLGIGPACHDDRRVHHRLPVTQHVERDIGGHQLGGRGRIAPLAGAVGRQHLAGGNVDCDGRHRLAFGRGLFRRGLFGLGFDRCCGGRFYGEDRTQSGPKDRPDKSCRRHQADGEGRKACGEDGSERHSAQRRHARGSPDHWTIGRAMPSATAPIEGSSGSRLRPSCDASMARTQDGDRHAGYRTGLRLPLASSSGANRLHRTECTGLTLQAAGRLSACPR